MRVGLLVRIVLEVLLVCTVAMGDVGFSLWRMGSLYFYFQL
ncbi:putative membrane protein [Anaplasma phagocytophilum str. CRT53-1]|uniref:Uncharacterized protein n=6 Tax=Anaplasma phagocytophilum TaxID=948 RepID=A0A098EDP1_ANAPH|nr:hypothetical protein YYU_01935 [Anaplasma phagocytophilum str. HZ2]AGR80547.1 hypothetical protein WSQ_01945 [Anaplasma phagocytophilum str. JM]AGR81806.1 hypothetical protein YYY_01970 [Anaplasma phagocytophilum str. Dog2]KJV59645.1 putative membrane protein [Anaplasma phagocytophilum str. Webster]KJV65173.1 putative membrane protein [Anaplasma phagocytophilum str. ApMUC09]KJV66081.1 putative membrane protein [Anaplasma phagocytophilum str. NCH-1]KJV66984.1 putative membrane protein [Anap